MIWRVALSHCERVPVVWMIEQRGYCGKGSKTSSCCAICWPPRNSPMTRNADFRCYLSPYSEEAFNAAHVFRSLFRTLSNTVLLKSLLGIQRTCTERRGWVNIPHWTCTSVLVLSRIDHQRRCAISSPLIGYRVAQGVRTDIRAHNSPFHCRIP